jgi:hypothetical protein
LLIYSGCAKNAVKKESEREILRTRAAAYWEHKVNGEFDKSYAYEDPFYRKKISMINYIKSIDTSRARWTGAEVLNVALDGPSADVTMKIRIQLAVAGSGQIEHDAVVKEKWIKSDGIWHHVYQ